MENKKISYIMENGKKVTVTKRFRNLHHFDNYFNKLVQSNCNVYKIETVNDHVQLANDVFLNNFIV